jgi:hypothetical protein
MRVEAAFAAIHASEGHHQKLRDLFLLNERHVIADVNVPARMTWHHRHGKGRLLLPKHFGIGVRRETPDFRPDHVKRHRAYAHLAPHPTLLLPGTQPLQRNVGAKAPLAAFDVRQRRRQRVETPTTVQRHLPCFGVVVARRAAVANDPERACAITLNAVQAAWLDESSRTQLRRGFEEEIEALTRTFSAS